MTPINNFLVPKSCHYYMLKGGTVSGNYVIDPDGSGKYPPFTTHCDFRNDKYEGTWFDILFSIIYIQHKIAKSKEYSLLLI